MKADYLEIVKLARERVMGGHLLLATDLAYDRFCKDCNAKAGKSLYCPCIDVKDYIEYCQKGMFGFHAWMN